MRQIKAEGIVLKRINTGEADRVITIYTNNLGKISVFARGVRRIKSRRSGNLELFNHVKFSLIETKNLPILTEAEALETFPNIRKNLKLIGLAYHVSELVDKMSAEKQENEDVFNLLLNVLSKMNNVRSLKTEEKDGLIRNFEINFLESLGFLSGKNIAKDFNVRNYIEELLERELKSKNFIEKL